jgi:hypothetical protein
VTFKSVGIRWGVSSKGLVVSVGARYGRVVETIEDAGHVRYFGAAFPAALGPKVAAVAAAIPESGHTPARPFIVRVDEELVSIPYRIHNTEPPHDTRRYLSPVQRTVMSCLYTRHDDGWIRQRHLESIVGQAETWVAPFVVQLFGEYVVEISLARFAGRNFVALPGIMAACF